MQAADKRGRASRRQSGAGVQGETNNRDVAAALAELRLAGAVTGSRSQKISVRVDPGVMRAAATRFGLTNPSDVVNASLAVAAEPNQFKAWWEEPRGTLPDDFELAV